MRIQLPYPAIWRCAHYDAVGRGIDRRAGRCREIDALMHEHRAEPLAAAA